MSNSNGIQQALFQQVKDQLPGHLSFVDEISDLLEISNDSAYRRIRGEKELSLKETQKVCHCDIIKHGVKILLKVEVPFLKGYLIKRDNITCVINKSIE